VALDRQIRAALVGTGLVRVKLWNRRDQIVYSNDRQLIGRSLPPSDELKKALAGHVASEVSDLRTAENVADRGHGDLLEVYVPLRFGRSTLPSGAFELYLAYRPIAAAVRRDTRVLLFALVGGLLLLWLSLFRIVAPASRTLRKQADENAYLALHDQLTELPNRSLFLDRAEQALRRAKREGTGMAVLLLDLDRFKEINDTRGHHSGDLLLQQVGPRLRALLREIDTVARLGGDEFAILLPAARGADVVEVAEPVRKALERPFTVERLPLALEASIGIALFPDHGGDVVELLQRADVAMYLAKHNGSGYQRYEQEHDSSSASRLRLLGELRRAIEQQELVVYYQPQVDARSGALGAVEALLRCSIRSRTRSARLPSFPPPSTPA
jgi:diguanylate cyclase (GGDEF)-like protein